MSQARDWIKGQPHHQQHHHHRFQHHQHQQHQTMLTRRTRSSGSSDASTAERVTVLDGRNTNVRMVKRFPVAGAGAGTGAAVVVLDRNQFSNGSSRPEYV